MTLFAQGPHVKVDPWKAGSGFPPALIGYTAELLIAGVLATTLYLWLRAVSRWRFFYVIWGLLSTVATAFLIAGLSASLRILTMIERYGTATDVVSCMVRVLSVGVGYLEVSPHIVMLLFVLPFLAALLFAIWFRVYGRPPESPRTNRFVLGVGLVVLLILAGCVTRNAIHVVTMKERVRQIKAIGATPLVDSGCMTGVSFRKGRPHLSIVAEQHDLRNVYLYGCDVHDDDIQYLTGLSQLSELDLTNTPITDRCIPSLERLPLRCMLRISGTRISKNGVQRLKTKRSAERIVYER